MLSRILISLLLIVFVSCGIIGRRKLYSDKFLQTIKQSKQFSSTGDYSSAFGVLDQIKEEKLSAAEKAMKFNMRGFIFFSQKKYDEAIVEFKKAISNETPDENLLAQVNLNLASSYFKINDYKSAFVYITNVTHKHLGQKDFKVYTKLYYILAKEVNEPYDIVRALVMIHREAKSVEEVRNGQYSSVIKENYFSISKTGRMRLLEEFEGKNNFSIAFLSIQEAKKLYYTGDKSSARDVLQWVREQFKNDPVVSASIESLMNRMQSFAKMISGNVGVILPLSGKRSKFGQKALYGIDTALNSVKGKNFELFVKDSKDSEIVSTMAIRELVEKHFVSFIVGGLFSSTAKEEYLEAKKYGVIFISLSPIYLPKDQKNHLLIEVPGSIESQVNTIFSDRFLSAMGNNVAVLYPNSEGGEAYVNELWRIAKSKNVNITSIFSYDRKRTDYREPVKKLLGLHYTRERQEEYDLWNEVYSLKKSTIRRIQTLAPSMDFDWVFVPSFPKETIQIIPSFSYFDAKGVKFVGGPSWRSAKILRNYRNLGKLFFVGENFEKKQNFSSEFFKRYHKSPKLLETMAYDAAVLGMSIVNQDFSTREELESSLTITPNLKARFGEWNLVDGIWVKKMDPLTFYSGKIVEANLTPMVPTQEETTKSNQ